MSYCPPVIGCGMSPQTTRRPAPTPPSCPFLSGLSACSLFICEHLPRSTSSSRKTFPAWPLPLTSSPSGLTSPGACAPIFTSAQRTDLFPSPAFSTRSTCPTRVLRQSNATGTGPIGRSWMTRRQLNGNIRALPMDISETPRHGDIRALPMDICQSTLPTLYCHHS